MKPTAVKDTRTHILDVAEKHFATNGFAGTSLRGIIKDAKVNVAAVAYHFGTKEDLYVEVMERFAVPVVTQQLEQLRAVLHEPTENEITPILRAFYEPPLSMIKKMGKRGETLSLFLGRAQTEPEPVYSLVDKNYEACRNEFIEAFKQVTPGLSDADYHWRFEFMLSLIVCFLTRQNPIRRRYNDEGEWQPGEVVNRLIDFCSRGFQSETS